jgi:alkylation response protein AidB-like acyl-CoA dehydrogenase
MKSTADLEDQRFVARTLREARGREQERFLAPVLEGAESCCLGVVEPHGLDPSSLQTCVAVSAEGLVVSGTKVLVRDADRADRMLTLADGGPRGQLVLSVDLRLPGVTLTPMQAPLDEAGYWRVELDRVAIARDETVEIAGREFVDAYLAYEEGRMANVEKIDRLLGGLIERVSAAEGLEDLRRPVASAEVALAALKALHWRCCTAAPNDTSAELQAIARMRASELLGQVLELQVHSIGYYALPYSGRLSHNEGKPGPPGAEEAVRDALICRLWADLRGPLADKTWLAKALGIDGDDDQRGS